MLLVLAGYLGGSVLTAMILGYLGYDCDGRDFPPTPILVVFWPLTLLVYFYLRLFHLGQYIKNAKLVRAQNKARNLAALPETPPQPVAQKYWLGPR
jgi:hypothetical protein